MNSFTFKIFVSILAFAALSLLAFLSMKVQYSSRGVSLWLILFFGYVFTNSIECLLFGSNLVSTHLFLTSNLFTNTFLAPGFWSLYVQAPEDLSGPPLWSGKWKRTSNNSTEVEIYSHLEVSSFCQKPTCFIPSEMDCAFHTTRFVFLSNGKEELIDFQDCTFTCNRDTLLQFQLYRCSPLNVTIQGPEWETSLTEWIFFDSKNQTISRHLSDWERTHFWYVVLLSISVISLAYDTTFFLLVILLQTKKMSEHGTELILGENQIND